MAEAVNDGACSTTTPRPNTTCGSTTTSRPSRVSWLRNTVSGATSVAPANMAAVAQPLLNHPLGVGELRPIVDAMDLFFRHDDDLRPMACLACENRPRRSGSIRPWRCRSRSDSRTGSAISPRNAIRPPLQRVIARSASVASLCSRMSMSSSPDMMSRPYPVGSRASNPSDTTAAPLLSGSRSLASVSVLDQRRIRVDHDHVVILVRQRFPRAENRMSPCRAVPSARRSRPPPRAFAVSFATLSPSGPTTTAMPSRSSRCHGGQHMPEHRAVRDLMKNFRPVGLHPGAFSGCQHDGQTCTRGRFGRGA